jgi:hypothetical protein
MPLNDVTFIQELISYVLSSILKPLDPLEIMRGIVEEEVTEQVKSTSLISTLNFFKF